MLICLKFDFRCKDTTFFRYMQIFFLFFSCVYEKSLSTSRAPTRLCRPTSKVRSHFCAHTQALSPQNVNIFNFLV